MKKNFLLFCIILLTACSSKQRETLAHITQRRVDAGGKVMISYQFLNGTSLVSDSMEVAKTSIVPHDSVKVIFSPENPTESHLVLP
ncbi:MAG: hypothetical protein V4557_16015 [Bacteroidota bacterium]